MTRTEGKTGIAELCAHAFSATTISAKRLDESLARFASRPLQEPFLLLRERAEVIVDQFQKVPAF